MKSVESIREALAGQSSRLGAFRVAHLWLFGSAARGDAEVRDLDFLVEFSTTPGLLEFMDLKFFLEELFKMPVDLHTRSSCPDRFFERIRDELKNVA
jgi:predicted nucleotidyltransferase